MEAASEAVHSRIILLNRLVSRSVTRAPTEHKAPINSGVDLFDIIEQRVKSKVCIEFFDVDENEPEDAKRIAAFKNKNFIRIDKIKRQVTDNWIYLGFLVNYVDQKISSFPVIDIDQYSGRDLSGEANERGTFSAHVVVRLPNGENHYDDGSYRCAVESVSNLSRSNIEKLLSRQLRRVAEREAWTFDVQMQGKKKPITKQYKYHSRFELHADVGRSMFGDKNGAKELTHLIFTNRHEKQSFPEKTAIDHEAFYASVELKISAKQGPDDPIEKKNWFERIKSSFELRGYTTKMYFRTVKGDKISGSVNSSVAGATDLLLCPRETIYTSVGQNKWLDAIQPEVYDKMKVLLDRDELWEKPN